MNLWILEKIKNYLTLEGCSCGDAVDTLEGMELELIDSFGFRYELSIKTLSRKDAENVAKIGSLDGHEK